MPRPIDVVYPNKGSTSSSHTGSNKKLPIVLCLDVSPSMFNYDRFLYQNMAVKQFLQEIVRLGKVRIAAEVAFVTFSDKIVYETDFMPISAMHFGKDISAEDIPSTYQLSGKTMNYTLTVPHFRPVEYESCTELPESVGYAHKKLKERLNALIRLKTLNYASFLVVCTDGNPDTAQYGSAEMLEYQGVERKVVRELGSRCNPGCRPSELILPFFIGIGSDGVDMSGLQRLAGNLPSSFYPIRNTDDDLYRLGDVFAALARTIANSINYNSTNDLLKLISDTVKAAANP